MGCCGTPSRRRRRGSPKPIAWGREGHPDLTVLRGRPEFTRLFEGIDPNGAKPRDDAE